MAYFTVKIESIAEIGAINITQIKLMQGEEDVTGGEIIYLNGEPKGWALDPEFYFNVN